MRAIVIDRKTDLRALRSSLLGDETERASAFEELKNLNPHVNFKKIEPGTVLLIPDTLGYQGAGSFSVTGDAFDALREQIMESIDAAALGAVEGYKTLLAEQKEVAAALKSAAVKKAIKADPKLKAQIEAGSEVFKRDLQDAKDSAKAMQTLREQAAAELAALARLLG